MEDAEHFAATRKFYPSLTILASDSYWTPACTILGKMDSIADLFCALSGRVQQPGRATEPLRFQLKIANVARKNLDMLGGMDI